MENELESNVLNRIEKEKKKQNGANMLQECVMRIYCKNLSSLSFNGHGWHQKGHRFARCT